MNSFRLLYFRLYVYSLPFSFAFSFSDSKITFSLLISIGMLLNIIFVSFFKILSIRRKVLWFLLPASIFFIYIIYNAFINIHLNQGYFNHVFSYLSSIFFFLIAPVIYIEIFKIEYNFKLLFYDIFIITFISSLYGFSQFTLNNFFTINLDDYIYWPTNDLSNALSLGQYFRTKSFFAEPGHFALFLECFIPLIFWYFYKTKLFKYPYFKNALFLIIVSSFILTFSAAGFFCLVFSIVVSIIINYTRLNINFTKLIFRVIVITTLLYIGYYYTDELFSIYDIIFTNSIGKLDSSSSEDRLDRLKLFSDIVDQMNIKEFLFGFGPNATISLGYDSSFTIVLLFPLIFVELGFIGLILFFLIIISLIYYSFNIKGIIRFYLHISLISVITHYLFISNYWYPYLWFLGFVVFILANTQSKHLILLQNNQNILYENK